VTVLWQCGHFRVAADHGAAACTYCTTSPASRTGAAAVAACTSRSIDRPWCNLQRRCCPIRAASIGHLGGEPGCRGRRIAPQPTLDAISLILSRRFWLRLAAVSHAPVLTPLAGHGVRVPLRLPSPAWYERAAARWIARLIAERPGIRLAELELVAASFREAVYSGRGVGVLRHALETSSASPTRPLRGSANSPGS
jgi:hypothetical protein